MGASVLGGLDGTGLVSTESAVIINDGCCVLVLLEGDGAIIPFAESWSMLTVYEEEFQIRNGCAEPTPRSLVEEKKFFNLFFFLLKPDVLVLRWALLWASLRRLDDQVSQRGFGWCECC